jgi:CRP/FNR family transcriptional regulator, anaerobic regulatory protein
MDIKKELGNSFPDLGRSPEVLDGLASISARKSLPAGLQVYSEGDACSSIAFVLSGAIRVYKLAENGREITLYEIGPGETCILNASCILAGLSYPANAVCLADTDVVLASAAGFRRLMDAHEPLRQLVFRILSERLAGVMELISEVAFGRMDARLMDYISNKSEDGSLAATHQRIADDLGTSREVVSRLLKEFERRGVVELSRSSIRLTGAGR